MYPSLQNRDRLVSSSLREGVLGYVSEEVLNDLLSPVRSFPKGSLSAADM